MSLRAPVTATEVAIWGVAVVVSLLTRSLWPAWLCLALSVGMAIALGLVLVYMRSAER